MAGGGGRAGAGVRGYHAGRAAQAGAQGEPGARRRGLAGGAAPPAAGRSASQTRQRLSSYQQGIREARAAAPGDETDIGDEACRAS